MYRESLLTNFVLVAAVSVSLIGTSFIGAAQAQKYDEVVVTATKRETTIKDAPISVAVVSGETIDNYDITDLTDLQGFVPNLAVQKTFGNWIVRIRGMGSGAANPAFDSSVSIFNDGIYCGRSRCLELGYMDVGAVEVARGPQGALFGKSTVAGALAISSARPTDEFESKVTIGTELENGGEYLNGHVSGSLSDNLRARLAFQTKDLDGDMKNTFTASEDGGVEGTAARLSLEWDINETTELWMKAETADLDVKGNRLQLVKLGGAANPAAGIDTTVLETNLDGVKHSSPGYGPGEFDHSQQSSFVAQLKTEIMEGHELSVLIGHWELDYNNYLGVVGVPEPVLNTRLFEDYEQDSIELRVLSPTGGSFDYIVGALYHTSDTNTRQHSQFFPTFYKAVNVPAAVVDAAFAAADTLATGSDRYFYRDTDTISIYGQLAWHATERLSVIADLRWTDEEQKGKASNTFIVFNDGYTPTVVDAAPLQRNPEFVLYQTRDDDSLDPSIRLLYEVNDDTNVYIAYSEGSKPGGLTANDGGLGRKLNQKITSNPGFKQRYLGLSGDVALTNEELLSGLTLAQGNGVFDFEDEEAENWEIGVKAILRDNIYVNATVFTMDFTNLQTSVYDGDNMAFITKNAAGADIDGLELEVYMDVNENLSINFAGAYLDAKYRDFKGTRCLKNMDDTLEVAGCVNGEGDLSGRRIERTPEHELNLGIAWEDTLSNGLTLNINTDIYHSGDLYIREDFDPQGYQASFSKLNARVALSSEKSRWSVALIGRNLTDKRTIQHALQVLSEMASVSSGRSVSLEASYSF